MKGTYTGFVLLFIVFVSIFAYIDTKKGFKNSYPLLLRILVPMALSGVIVRLLMFIGSNFELVAKLIGGIGTIIFYIVFVNIFKSEKQGRRRISVADYFLGFIIGVIRGWLFFAFIVVYIDLLQLINFGSIGLNSFVKIIEKPVEWILFLNIF